MYSKKIFSLLVALLLGGCLMAQMRQVFPLEHSYSTLTVESGWVTRLVQSGTPIDKQELAMAEVEDSLDRIVVYADVPLMASQLYSLRDGQLTLKANRQLPQETRVEIFTSQRVTRIELKPRAVMSLGRFEGYGDLTVALWKQSSLVADTLSAPSLKLGFKGNDSYFHCNVIETLQVLFDEDQGSHRGTHCASRDGKVSEEAYLLRPYTGSASRMVDLWEEAPTVRFYDRCSLHIGINARVMDNNCYDAVNNLDSPFYIGGRFNCGVPLYAKWRINERWDARGGLEYDFYFTQVQNVTTIAWDHPLVAMGRKSNSFRQHMLGIPLSLTYHCYERKPDALTLNVGLLAERQLFSPIYVGPEVFSTELPNPWRLEVRFGMETNLLGVIHGVQYYVNLLPTYRNIPGASHFRESGIAIYF